MADPDDAPEPTISQHDALFAALPLGCFALDAHGRLVYWNGAAEAMFGLPLAAAADQSPFAAVVASHERDIAARAVRVDVNLGAEQVRADRGALTQLLQALIDNALRFTAHTADPRIEIGSERRAGSVRLWVRDNGIGFDMQYHDRIFRLFARLHREEEYPGSGVGLALVRKAVQRMAGRVWADSTPGDGAPFYVELPG